MAIFESKMTLISPKNHLVLSSNSFKIDLGFSHTFTLNMIVSCQKCENWSKNKLEKWFREGRLFRSTHLKLMFDDFELESANLSKSDFRPNPTKSLKRSQSQKIPKKSSKSFKPIQLCSIKNNSVLPNTIFARTSRNFWQK